MLNFMSPTNDSTKKVSERPKKKRNITRQLKLSRALISNNTNKH